MCLAAVSRSTAPHRVTLPPRTPPQDEAGGGLPPQLDLRSEVKGLDAHIAWDFSEALSKRARLQEQAASLAPHACPGTPAQAALVRSEALLVARLQELNHELSDASLQQVCVCVLVRA
jgi:hypothetical protein